MLRGLGLMNPPYAQPFVYQQRGDKNKSTEDPYQKQGEDPGAPAPKTTDLKIASMR